MAGWGSWANTQKLAGKERWPFQLYYWDYVIGVTIASVLFLLTLGGAAGSSAANLGAASATSVAAALLSGVEFNISNLLLVVAIDAAGMAVAFPVGVGLALVIGTIRSYIQDPRGDVTLLAGGVVLVVFAMVMSAVAYRRLPRKQSGSGTRGLIFAVIAGCLMGFFYPQLMRAISPNFGNSPIQPGMLTPYGALLCFAIGVLASNFVVNTIFMKAGGHKYSEYFAGSPRLHSLGVLGGIIWMIALTLNVLASDVAGPAISYALGQGATLVAAIWGVFVWREFQAAPRGTTLNLGLMFAGYLVGLTLIGMATL